MKGPWMQAAVVVILAALAGARARPDLVGSIPVPRRRNRPVLCGMIRIPKTTSLIPRWPASVHANMTCRRPKPAVPAGSSAIGDSDGTMNA